MDQALPTLTYQTVVHVGGQALICVESYDSIHERIRDSHFKLSDSQNMTWLEPIELTVCGEGNRPLRCLVQPQAISAVVEVLAQERREVAV